MSYQDKLRQFENEMYAAGRIDAVPVDQHFFALLFAQWLDEDIEVRGRCPYVADVYTRSGKETRQCTLFDGHSGEHIFS